MELKNITLAEGMPKSITVEMSIEEAVWIAIIAGKQRGESPHSEIYGCLTGELFNRFWDDGVDDAKRSHFVETPPIVYTED